MSIVQVSEDDGETPEKCAQSILALPAMKRICSARGRSVVNSSTKYDDIRYDEDSDDEYEEDYEDDSDDSLSEEKNQQSQAASSADNDQPSSPVKTGPGHSSQSLDHYVDEECQSASEENETSSPREEAPSPAACSSSNMAACKSGVVKRKVPLCRRKSVFPLFSPIMDIPNTCSLQKLSRETPVHTAAPPTESASDENKQTTLAALDEMREQLKVLASANAPSDDDPDQHPDDQPNTTPSKKDKVNLYYDMICRFEYTPLKPIADDLILLHTDLLPTEVCPTLNRSPSFIGAHNQDDGLLSGRSSPKLDIPHNRYHGHKIHQHPLARYTQKMKKPVQEDQKCSTITKCSENVRKGAVSAQDVAEHQQVVEEHLSVSGEVEKSSSENNDATNGSESQDSKDNFDQQVGELVEYHPQEFCGNSNDDTSIGKNNVRTKQQQAEEQVEDPLFSEDEISSSSSSTSFESEKQDVVEVYTPEQLAAKFGNSTTMESETSSKEKKCKVASKLNPYEQCYAKKLVQGKAAPQPLPVLKSCSYMVAYRKKVYLEKVYKCYSAPLKLPVRYKTSQTQLSKKLTLPPIGNNYQEQQQIVRLVPSPPTAAPPTSGPLSAVRNMRRKQYQKKTLQEAVKLVPAHFSHMLDSPQSCINYVENVS